MPVTNVQVEIARLEQEMAKAKESLAKLSREQPNDVMEDAVFKNV